MPCNSMAGYTPGMGAQQDVDALKKRVDALEEMFAQHEFGREASGLRHTIHSLNSQLIAVEALLCGIASALEGDGLLRWTLDRVDWGKVGLIEADFYAWYREHQRKDLNRVSNAKEKGENWK